MPAASAIKVLVVDDQKTMRELVAAALRDIGFKEIAEASDGALGLQSLLQHPVHLVISDFNMPNMDGLGLLRSVRTNDVTKKAAFIMLTGRADKELVQRAQQFGVNNYLVKPFSVAQLRQKIEAVFGPLT
jgi:two-component system chemotaxis response regulator CheY